MEAFSNVGIWPTGDGRWTLVGNIVWHVGKTGSGFVLTVHDGFTTDLASIPHWAQWLLNPYAPDTTPAALVHDALLDQGVEYRVAAGEFYRVMTICKVPFWKRFIFYMAVVLASGEWDNAK